MKPKAVFDHRISQKLDLKRQQIVALRGGRIRIACLQGTLWISWPGYRGCERLLRDGQDVTIHARGLVCLWAFSPVVVRVWRHHLLHIVLRLLEKMVYNRTRKTMDND